MKALLMTAVAAAFACTACYAEDKPKGDSKVASPLDFKMDGLDGKEVDLAKYKGKVVLLDFWGTWCGPCVEKLPKVQQFAEKYAGRDVVVIGIHSEQSGETCREFVEKNKYSFPMAIDSGKTSRGRGAVQPGQTALFDGDAQ